MLSVVSALSSSPTHCLCKCKPQMQFRHRASLSMHLMINKLNVESEITSKVMYDLNTATAKSLQSCLTLCDPIDGSPPGSPVPGILQARTLEWVAISFSNA